MSVENQLLRNLYLFFVPGLHQISGIAPFAGSISHIDNLFSAAGVDLFIFLFHIVHAGACGIVEFLGVGIQHISNSLGFLWCRRFRCDLYRGIGLRLWCRCLFRNSRYGTLAGSAALRPVITGGIVNTDPGCTL